jgi:hypothetical protein
MPEQGQQAQPSHLKGLARPVAVGCDAHVTSEVILEWTMPGQRDTTAVSRVMYIEGCLLMVSLNEENWFKFAHQVPIRGVPARRVAEFIRWWMGVNYQTTVIHYAPDANAVRIAMLIEASTVEEAIRQAQLQLEMLKRDITGEQVGPPTNVPSWPAWAEDMIGPLLYKREHGNFPPTYRPTREPPPDLMAALQAMANPAATREPPPELQGPNERTSILMRQAPAELYESLGLIAAHGAALEQVLGDLIAQLARVSGTGTPEEDPMVHHRGRFSDLVKRAKSAVDEAGGYISADVLSATRNFLTRVENLLVTRNQFIHSQWWWYAESDGSEHLICRRLPQSSQEAGPVEWTIPDVQDLAKAGRYFRELDQQSRILVARIMTLADRIQGLEDPAEAMRVEMDISGVSVEGRAAILSRLHAGLPPEGLEFLGRVANVEPVNDPTHAGDQQPSDRIRIHIVDEGTVED